MESTVHESDEEDLGLSCQDEVIHESNDDEVKPTFWKYYYKTYGTYAYCLYSVPEMENLFLIVKCSSEWIAQVSESCYLWESNN